MSSKTTRFEKLLEAVPDALVGMDQKGVIRFVNRQTESLFGYDRDDLIGQPIETLVPESLWQIYAQHREGYFADPRTRSSGLDLELSGRLRDGTEFPVNISLSHIDTGDVLLVITAVRDVTKLRQAVRNAELVAAIVEYSDDAISGSTLAGFVTSWNPAAERMYGYSRKEMIGRSASLLAPDDRAGEMSAVLDRIKDGEAVEHLETTLVRKDGTRFPVSMTVSPIRDENGAVVGACAVHRDVTEQRQALAVAQHLAAIVQGSDDAIIATTLQGIITSWNRAAERLFGYSSEELIGTSAGALIPKDRADEMRAILAKVSAGQHIEHLETIRVRKDAKVFPVSLTVSPISDRHGVVVGACVICRDVTELKHAERYARSLIEAGLDPLVTISAEGKITDVNEATVKVTGIPRNKLIGTDFSGYFTDPGKAHEGYQQVFARGSVTDYRLTLRHRDGTLTDVLYNASVYRGAAGQVLGVFAAARDVTQQRQVLAAAQHLAAIVQFSGEAIIATTLEGIITSWNPAAEKLYGYSSDQIIGKSASVLSPKDRSGEIISILARVKDGEAAEDFETFGVRKDLTVVPVCTTCAPIRDADGVIIGVCAIVRDMTGQRQALIFARLAAAIEFSGEAIISTTLAGIITSWNPAAEKLYGYSSEEIIGKCGTLLMPVDRKGEVGDIMAQIRAGEPVENFETIRARKDGTVFPICLTITPIRDADGTIIGSSSTPRDITKQKEAFECAQHMAVIVQNSADAIVAQTLEGTVTSWNPAAEKLYGYRGEEIIGKPVALLSPQARTGEITASLARIKAGWPVEHHESIGVRKDGTVIPVLLTVSAIRGANGAIVGASVIHRAMPIRADMTEQK